MMRLILALGLAVVTAPALAQAVSDAPGGLLRVLDKLSGVVQDLDLGRGQSQVIGRLTVQLNDCRYPTDNPASDAFAHLTVHDSVADAPIFAGWMVASSPALSALDHPRYDVWVLRCDFPDAPTPEDSTPEGE